MAIFYNNNNEIIKRLSVKEVEENLTKARNDQTIFKVEILKGVVRIGDKFLNECRKVKKVIMSNSIKIIGNSAFAWCDSLKKMTLSKNIEVVESYGLAGCRVVEFKFTNKLKEIGENAFSNDSCCCEQNRTYHYSIIIPKTCKLSKLGNTNIEIIRKDLSFEEETDEEETDTEETEKTTSEQLKEILKQYIQINKHEFIKPTKPDLQSINDKFIESSLMKLKIIEKTMLTLDEQLKDLDEFMKQHNAETNEISELINAFKSL